jgi:peptide-methionine (R)-S-oxide reductase
MNTRTLSNPNRRGFLTAVTAAIGASCLVAADMKNGGAPKMVRIAEFDATGKRKDVVEVPKVVKTDAEWHKQLDSNEFDITRRQGTEPAFTGKYWNLHEDGLFSCICCGTTLFDSKTKFESGTGWPSFYQPIAKENVTEHIDRSFGETRTEIECARCDAHLGHLFDDGPKPTGLRYCMDSASLKFAPRGKASA